MNFTIQNNLYLFHVVNHKTQLESNHVGSIVCMALYLKDSVYSITKNIFLWTFSKFMKFDKIMLLLIVEWLVIIGNPQFPLKEIHDYFIKNFELLSLE